MKRTIFPSALVVLALLAGCARESMDNLSPESHSILAVIEKDLPETRTVTIDNPGVRISTHWQAGDRIGVLGKSGGPAEFSVASNDISADGKSANFRSETSVPSGSLLAFYPWHEGASASGNKLTINVPATQKYTLHSGISQPDASSSIMVASGSASIGLPFRNVMSMLKIGQAFDAPVTITKLEFRDLSGMAVCGSMTVDLDNNYSTEFSGNGTVLTLDCGKGVELKEKEMGKFFLIVPARNYPKGFEVTFITSAGEQFTRQAGVSMGKTLEKGVVYPVGDVPARDYAAPDVKTEFMPGVTLISGENLDKVKVISKEMIEPGGGLDPMPIYNMMVQNDLNPVVGGYFVLEANEDLPSGSVYVIQQVEPYGGNYKQVRIVPADNPACAYKNLDIGGDMWDEEGNLIEDAGLDIDLSNYLSEIVDSEGNPIPFSVSQSGQILLTEEAADRLLGTKGLTRGDKSFTTPSFNYQLAGDDDQSVTFAASITLNMKAAVRITDGELVFLHFTAHPEINLSVEFALSREWEKSVEIDLATFRFVPGVPIAPGLVMEPRLNVRIGMGVFANLNIKAGLSYTYDCGQYGFSYLQGQGFFFRHQDFEPKPAGFNPQFSMNAEAHLGVYSTLNFFPSLHIWGLIGAGIDTEIRMTFSLDASYSSEAKPTNLTDNLDYYGSNSSLKLQITPKVTCTPRTVSIGGWLTKKWDKLSFSKEWDPIWEQHLIPSGAGGLKLNYETKIGDYIWTTVIDDTNFYGVGYRYNFYGGPNTSIMTAVNGFDWGVDFDTEHLLSDWDAYVYIYEGSGIINYVNPDNYLSESWLMYDVSDMKGRPIEAYPPGRSLRVLNNPCVVSKLKLCTLKAGEQNGIQRGSVSYPFKPYVPYGYAFALVRGDYEIVYQNNAYTVSPYELSGMARYYYDGNNNFIKEDMPNFADMDNYGYHAFCLWWPKAPAGENWLVNYHVTNGDLVYDD